MRYNDPNRPEPIAPERPVARDTDTAPAGNIAEAGYQRIARRPRGRFMDEMVPEARADRIEGIFSMPPNFDMDAD